MSFEKLSLQTKQTMLNEMYAGSEVSLADLADIVNSPVFAGNAEKLKLKLSGVITGKVKVSLSTKTVSGKIYSDKSKKVIQILKDASRSMSGREIFELMQIKFPELKYNHLSQRLTALRRSGFLQSSGHRFNCKWSLASND